MSPNLPMKKVTQSLLALILAVLPVTGFSAASDVLFSQKNASNTAWSNVVVSPVANGVMSYSSAKVPISSSLFTFNATTGLLYAPTVSDAGGTLAAQRNALATAQGLSFVGGVTGKATATLASALGTGDISIRLKTLLRAASSGYPYLLALGSDAATQNSVNGFRFTYEANGYLRVLLFGATTGDARYAEFDLSALQSTVADVVVTRTAGVIAVYANGAAKTQVGPDVTAGTPPAWTATGSAQYLTLNDGNATVFSVVPYNRALSAAEVLALYQTGAVARADIPSQVAGTALITGTDSNFSGAGNWGAINGATFTVAAGKGVLSTLSGYYSAASINDKLVSGTRYLFSMTASAFVGGTTVSLGDGAGTLYAAISAGANSIEFVATYTGNLIIARGGGTATGVSLDDVTLVPLGALIAPEANAPGAGLEWLDVSGNRAHIVLPTSGVSWALPSSQQIVIEASTSTNGNQQLGGASLIDANKQWRIQSWTVNCSTGTPTISLGNASAGAQYVSAAVLASGNNDITLLSRFPTTANLWCVSTTTATLIHRIVLVPAN